VGLAQPYMMSFLGLRWRGRGLEVVGGGGVGVKDRRDEVEGVEGGGDGGRVGRI